MIKPVIMDHPLIQHKLTIMRDKNTGTKEFRELVGEIGMLMCYEATRDLPLKEVEIETPVAVAKTKVISGRKLAFVPILRAGLGMVDGVMRLVPAAKISRWNITASCPRISASGTSSFWTRCWQPAVQPSTPLPKSRAKARKVCALCVSSRRRRGSKPCRRPIRTYRFISAR